VGWEGWIGDSFISWSCFSFIISFIIIIRIRLNLIPGFDGFDFSVVQEIDGILSMSLGLNMDILHLGCFFVTHSQTRQVSDPPHSHHDLTFPSNFLPTHSYSA
jgi:hypothetical protein